MDIGSHNEVFNPVEQLEVKKTLKVRILDHKLLYLGPVWIHDILEWLNPCFRGLWIPWDPEMNRFLLFSTNCSLIYSVESAGDLFRLEWSVSLEFISDLSQEN